MRNSKDTIYRIDPIAQQQLITLIHAPALTYLLHFSQPIGNHSNVHATAQHYIGWCTDLHERMLQHHRGGTQGAKIVYAAYHRYNLDVTITRLWEGNWIIEKWLKRQKDANALCPACSPDRWMRYAANFPGIPVFDDPIPDFDINTKMDGLEYYLTKKMEDARPRRDSPSQINDDDDLL